VRRLALSGLDDILPQSHLDPREGSRGTGLWPLAADPLTPVAALSRPLPGPYRHRPAAARHRHRRAPGRAGSRSGTSLAAGTELIQATLAGTTGPQLAAGDFNASRDHGAFRALLRSGFVDCADAARQRAWPGLTGLPTAATHR